MRGAVQELNATKTEYGTALDREDKFLQDKRVVQHSVEKEPTEQKDLLEKDEELKRILDMPRSEMMKMISLRQEKEKLERKIRMKGLENKILKLRKELSQLELAKGDLELDTSPK
ncbi:hypothetical protein OS493_016373 [Desmophyllum pertusum]|uniref:Uncharacterized protein n=1 Tax=Desmophyllum pertusum TaxID=174260 RepID=A0A9W9ZSS7_9CNID|nr:hypothetical protein OS493_016373 [Desmophyllum pertusum]